MLTNGYHRRARRGSHPTAAFVTNIIAPYRIPTLRELARMLDVHVLFSAESESNREWSIQRDLPFSYEVVGGRSIHAGGRYFYPNPGLLVRLFRLRPRVVLVAGFSIPALWALVYCRLTGAGLVVTNEGTRRSEQTQVGLPGLLSRRVIVRTARACVGVSSDAVDRFEELGAASNKCFRSMYALDVNGRPARDHSLMGDRLRFLYVGQLIPRKGIREVLDGLAALGRDSEWELTMVGSGPLEDELRRQVVRLGLEGNVSFRGFVDQGDLPAVYADHDVFLFPSLLESFGVVPLEAMAAGVPVVASSLAGATRDVVEDGRSGWTMDPRDPAEVQRALGAALEARPRLVEMGQLARRAAQQNSPERSAAALAAAIERAVPA